MALNTRISASAAIDACNAVVDKFDVGTANATGKVEIRTGTQPADPDAAATGTLLVTILLQNPAFGAAVDASPGGKATVNGGGTLTGTAVATGTAGYFRAYDRDDVAIIDGECGTSGADMNLDSTSITSGQDVTIQTWDITEPQS